MFTNWLYWVALVSLLLNVLLSVMRRQSARELATARKNLAQEREGKDRVAGEMLRRETARAAAEKEAEAAKKEASAAKKDAEAAQNEIARLTLEISALGEARARVATLEAELVRATEERDAARAAQEESARMLQTRGQAEQAALRKIEELGKAAEAGRGEVAASAKKLEGEARLRKAAETERAALAAQIDKLQTEARALAEEAKSARARAEGFEADLRAARELGQKLDQEIAAMRAQAAVATPAPPTAAPVSGQGLLAALDADTVLNRGQKETIRMTYQQFTAKKRTS
jgi:DNA repair exonuclease SbcCD ATPase subunit